MVVVDDFEKIGGRRPVLVNLYSDAAISAAAYVAGALVSWTTMHR